METEPLMMNLIIDEVYQNRVSFEASEMIQDKIITKVATQMWEKEVMSKRFKPYVNMWARQFGPELTS